MDYVKLRTWVTDYLRYDYGMLDGETFTAEQVEEIVENAIYEYIKNSMDK